MLCSKVEVLLSLLLAFFCGLLLESPERRYLMLQMW